MSKTAVITGASSGLGKEYAFQLAEKGFNLIINSRSEATLKQIQADLEKEYSIQVKVLPADLTEISDLNKLCEEMEKVEDLKLLINNAGFGIPKSFMRVEYEKHQDMIDLHVTAVTKLTYTAVEIFLQNGGGEIITVASVAAFIGSGMYSGTKHFQLSLMKRLSKQYKKDGITFQALCPGYTVTNFHYTDDFDEIEIKEKVPKFLWLTKEFVVNDSLKNLERGKTVVIPSFKYKLIVFLSKLGIIRR